LQSLPVSQVTLDGACVRGSGEGGACPVGKKNLCALLTLG